MTAIATVITEQLVQDASLQRSRSTWPQAQRPKQVAYATALAIAMLVALLGLTSTAFVQ
jgi:hypothetical protein